MQSLFLTYFPSGLYRVRPFFSSAVRSQQRALSRLWATGCAHSAACAASWRHRARSWSPHPSLLPSPHRTTPTNLRTQSAARKQAIRLGSAKVARRRSEEMASRACSPFLYGLFCVASVAPQRAA